ncbi:AAA family ATPase [Microlunatus elymi]|uniref:AAA family ATPase n=1 Tax=Microlunatus elymi TaxID=2596828 RepID=A0A516PYX7_9ACTN|nr:RNA polymerase recycling motor ATPase HelR [Microlunatus elymi]QDP96389.1 AAA family ATPase [Microlunatus elymi]
MTISGKVFDLPKRLVAKADPALITADEEHFAAIRESLDQLVAELTERIDVLRRSPGGKGRAAADRDLEIHRLSARLRLLRRFGLDVCLGRMVDGEGEPTYVGRIGLTGRNGSRLLIDWRTPAAEPYFAATLAEPMGLVSRRRYRWTQGRITDYWDEALSPDALTSEALLQDPALDPDSAFIASLGSSRTQQMRDVLSTIQADQDAIIRAGSRGALVVDGGPGTGKTVVALHRAAYLLYSDPRVGEGRGGVLFVGPHRPYLAYVADVLPSLGEEGVQICTLRDLVAEGDTAVAETDPEVARLKAQAELVAAIEPAVGLYEEPPTKAMLVETDWGDLPLRAGDWAEAFAAAEPGSAHNEVRDQVWEALVSILFDRLAEELDEQDVTVDQLGRSLLGNESLTRTFTRAWTLIDADDLVSDLWSVPAYLRRCAPSLTDEQVRLLQREPAKAWTISDLPLLDAARQRLGDPDAPRRARRREAALAAEREQMDRVIDEIIEADDNPETTMYMLRGEDLRQALVDQDGLPSRSPDRLAGPFAHVIVDEAQELTDAEWQMLVRRCPSRSFTVVGDRAQARHGFTETWQERLRRVGFDAVSDATLTINYRTPAEVMTVAEPVIRAVLPDANVPISIRSGGAPVRSGRRSELGSIIEEWLNTHDDGIACVIGDPSYEGGPRVRSLSALESKGMEFDLVVLVDPDSFGTGIEGAVDHYVAMTRATQQLVILT